MVKRGDARPDKLLLADLLFVPRVPSGGRQGSRHALAKPNNRAGQQTRDLPVKIVAVAKPNTALDPELLSGICQQMLLKEIPAQPLPPLPPNLSQSTFQRSHLHIRAPHPPEGDPRRVPGSWALQQAELADPQHSLLGVSLLQRFPKKLPDTDSGAAGRPMADIYNRLSSDSDSLHTQLKMCIRPAELRNNNN
ncbi:unnamed protein product [Pleuronectes platessa]|uniref:Uncharacterized protein n=1 Tax=Pleuronectes platessa TaxID=8262 RepID=A0A9N7Y5I0_PLEPL|nr:unnamed protein product [Pleuronectes platessa]